MNTTNTTQVGGTTITKIGGSERKFYRVFVAGTTEVRQWGRIGATGQFKIIEHPGKRAAEASAEKQVGTKIGKGYGARRDVAFSVKNEVLTLRGSQLGRALSASYEAAEANADVDAPAPDYSEPSEPEPETTTATTETMQQVTDRALSVVTLAASGSDQAAVEYARLREQITEIDEQRERCSEFLETIELMLDLT